MYCYPVALLASLVMLLNGCKDGDVSMGSPPLFAGSTPANGAVDVAVTSEVSVTFNEVVSLSPSHGITVNNMPVTATVLFTRLTINVHLELNTSYTVKIPAGAVINTRGVRAQDDLEFRFFTKAPVTRDIKPTLVVPNPSPQAVKVYNFLKDNYGSRIISGTMANVCWNINEAIWVNSKTGKYPALNGFDLIHLWASPANWINYDDVSVVESWWQNNGLVTFTWHWNVPKTMGSSEFAFYTNETTFNITNAVREGTWENGIVKADMARVGAILKKLQEKNIPVLWRPLHEAAGTWFWWGAGGPGPCIALWRMMFNYFKELGLNNLIWVWTVETGDDDWYPGDEYVDLIGRDLYNRNNIAWLSTHFESIQTKYPGKIVALTECGSVANISNQWNAGATWSFFVPWYDYNRTVNITGANFKSRDHQHANADWWVNTLSNPAVITRDEMPSLK